MFWGLSETWWMQLWSGVVGASIAAGVSIYVALIVVQRTNAHQSVLSGRALAEQRKRDAEALEEQRARDATALEVQRAALKEQLDEQREETARLRMMDIRADVVADANHILDMALQNMEAVERAIPPLSRSITRWRIESTDKDLVDELMNWPPFVGWLARDYRTKTDRKSVPLTEQNAAFHRLNNAVSLLGVVGIHTPTEDNHLIAGLDVVLRKMRVAINNGGTGDPMPSSGDED
ncbi:hypothetical protein QF038_001602 [Pseudarthrobacter sp. W1I19]|uniref:hypothetical protein n=1 Tax=Pseudarthrobacter sp. W1I19 TaxID=3042288 RepID=UPI00277F24CA|nr:hypothetical protein [Pseudarthrobacter sp. W1I19]MDQ0923094.1 hypothetical protein [Pseudarthrobacter sp. W1I19]